MKSGQPPKFSLIKTGLWWSGGFYFFINLTYNIEKKILTFQNEAHIIKAIGAKPFEKRLAPKSD